MLIANRSEGRSTSIRGGKHTPEQEESRRAELIAVGTLGQPEVGAADESVEYSGPGRLLQVVQKRREIRIDLTKGREERRISKKKIGEHAKGNILAVRWQSPKAT